MDTTEFLISELRQIASKLPDPRTGSNKQYSSADLVMSPFACFWTQDGSFLQFQRRMEDESQASNMQTLFKTKKIPTDDQIRNFLDQIDYKYFDEMYFKTLNMIVKNKHIDIFNVLGDQKHIVIALDGTQIFSSNNIHCDDCIVKEHRNGTTEYVHNVLQSSIVSPNTNLVLPLVPEFTYKNDSSKKQDCEQNATKRWFDKNYEPLVETLGHNRIIFLADDLHSHNPFVQILEIKDLKYILNCKENSHKTLFEFVNNVKGNSFRCEKLVPGFKEPKEHIYSWLCDLPLTEVSDTARVNWFSLTIKNVTKSRIEDPIMIDGDDNNKKGRKKHFVTIFKDLTFSFITNIEITESNICELIDIGRSRWKIENNNFHVLKNSGYKLDHNYGHGKHFLCNTLATLNILAFSFHKAAEICDEIWVKALLKYKSVVKFFQVINVILGIMIFKSFYELLSFIIGNRAPPD
jgi:hypothetical protein